MDTSAVPADEPTGAEGGGRADSDSVLGEGTASGEDSGGGGASSGATAMEAESGGAAEAGGAADGAGVKRKKKLKKRGGAQLVCQDQRQAAKRARDAAAEGPRAA